MTKDKKAKAVEKKLRVAQKQEKKSTQREKKINKKGKDQDGDDDDVDLDNILAEYQRQQELYLKVTETSCEAPSSRSSSMLMASPSNSNELFLFGGEYFNGSLAKFFNDLYVYNIKRDEWRLITSPNSPLPRSGHSCCRAGNDGGIYLFGGEFSSPKQGTFYHYNDFWRLDPSTREWTKIESRKGGPPARSGHRMTYYKNYILLFGGFQDTSQQTKYLQDLWIYDTQEYSWHSPVLPPASQKPDPRSSFSFLPHESGAVLYGGYSRVKSSVASKKQHKGGGSGSHDVLKPVVHQDTWFLRIVQPGPDSLANARRPTVRWEGRKKPSNLPNPPRAGATMAHHKGRGILFGGVHDVEESEEGLESEFFDALYIWNIDRNRFVQLSLRRPRASLKDPAQGNERGKRGRAKADEVELLRNLRALETGGSISDAQQTQMNQVEEDQEDEEGKVERAPKSVKWEMPHPRFNSQLSCQDDILYIFGGTFEKGDKEYQFQELLAIDLGKLDGVKELFKREIEAWQGSEDEESENDDEEEYGDQSDADDNDQQNHVGGSMTSTTDSRHDMLQTDSARGSSSPGTEVREDNFEATAITSAMTDSMPHPRPFESLKEFFARTSTQWQDLLIESRRKDSAKSEENTFKEVRKKAFERAEEKWWECREEIMILEDEQEASGIGEIVNIADRASNATMTTGRRR